MTVGDVRNKLEQLKGKRSEVENQLEDSKKKLSKSNKKLKRLEIAMEIVKQVAVSTQEQLSYNIQDLTTMAMSSVLKNPYDVKLNFVERSNKTECQITFSKDKMEIDPYDGGGGAIDVAAFALRVASWSMISPKLRNVIILDEPFQNLKGEAANRRMLEMVKEVSEKLNLQILMVSDERVSRETTVEFTDRLFDVSIKKGISQIK